MRRMAARKFGYDARRVGHPDDSVPGGRRQRQPRSARRGRHRHRVRGDVRDRVRYVLARGDLGRSDHLRRHRAPASHQQGHGVEPASWRDCVHGADVRRLHEAPDARACEAPAATARGLVVLLRQGGGALHPLTSHSGRSLPPPVRAITVWRNAYSRSAPSKLLLDSRRASTSAPRRAWEPSRISPSSGTRPIGGTRGQDVCRSSSDTGTHSRTSPVARDLHRPRCRLPRSGREPGADGQALRT